MNRHCQKWVEYLALQGDHNSTAVSVYVAKISSSRQVNRCCIAWAGLYVALRVTGPGSALQMSFNVEKYEYTKDTQSGVGIQVTKDFLKVVFTSFTATLFTAPVIIIIT